MPIIAPSILSADFARLGEEIAEVEEAGAKLLHVDVMDGHFVPQIMIGPLVVESIRAVTRLPLDVHLMIEAPERHIEAFVKAGANSITVHQEACPHLDRTVALIKSLGVSAGVSVNPATPLCTIEEILSGIDLVLLMSVNPGAGGQHFIDYVGTKIVRLRQRIDELNVPVKLEVDGGIKGDNLDRIAKAGADILVIGSGVYKHFEGGRRVSPREAYRRLAAVLN
jgi:ribulose-phosphate 3-epimerase